MSKGVILRLRAALQEGEASGWIGSFSLDGFLVEMHKEAKGKKMPSPRGVSDWQLSWHARAERTQIRPGPTPDGAPINRNRRNRRFYVSEPLR
jgi:hypothetical protein